ncbi:MAG: DUF2577 domain-containing protein [Clostridia bacterium]
MNIADAVKECAMKAYEASMPCEVLFGTVVSVEPVKIEVGQLILDEELLSVTDNLLYRECNISIGMYERTIVIQEGLKVGDGVVLLRQKGGEGYIAFAKL